MTVSRVARTFTEIAGSRSLLAPTGRPIHQKLLGQKDLGAVLWNSYISTIIRLRKRSLRHGVASRRFDWRSEAWRGVDGHRNVPVTEIDQRAKNSREDDGRRQRIQHSVAEEEEIADEVDDEDDNRGEENGLKPEVLGG